MTQEPKDKRTRAWKEWKANFDKENSTGLGDVIEKVTKATGIKKLVKFVAGDDCGCEERKEKLNKIKFSHRVRRCFTEDLYNKWTEFEKRKDKNLITYKQQREILIPVYAHLFAITLPEKSCCFEEIIESINKVYNEYQ